MRRLLLGAAGTLLAVSPVLGVPAALAAPGDGTATISHVQVGEDGRLGVLVSVPAGADVRLDEVTLSVDGTVADAEATGAGTGEAPGGEVRRTTVLAIDASLSMKGARFAAARAAANQYLDSVPDDVRVGIVAFNVRVRTLLEPTTDRDAAHAVIEDLKLDGGTHMYDGVVTAVKALGAEGQRTVLLLSDGANTDKIPVTDATSALEKAGVHLDAVALDQSEKDLAPLNALARAGKGRLIPAGTDALAKAFADEAAVLARQILVTATVPDAVTADEATVAVTLPTADGTLNASTYAVVRQASEPTVSVPDSPVERVLQLPATAMYGGLAAIGLGLLVLMVGGFSMASTDRRMKTVEQRIAAYGTAATAGVQKVQSQAFNLDEMKDAAASMLHRNRGLEARIEQRLEAAGSPLKPAEWLLAHGAIAIVAGLAGLLVGGGSLLWVVLGVVVGLAVPWLWLGYKRRRRVAAFNSGLADTLQLIAGSLSAGMSLAQAIDAVVNEGNEPIAGEFKRVLVETRLGVPLETALEGIAQRIESVDFAWVVMAIRIQREVGGNLAELLTTVSGTLRERDFLRRQVKTLSAEGRLSAYILISLPIGMFGYMMLARREYLRPLYTEPLGILMLIAAVLLLGLGWLMMSRIVKVEV